MTDPPLRKPPHCNCPYPGLIAKNACGHATTCPEYERWLAALGAGSVSDPDAEAQWSPRVHREPLVAEQVQEVALRRRSADEVAFTAATRITELQGRIAELYAAAGISADAPHEVAVYVLTVDTRRKQALYGLLSDWRVKALQVVPGSQHYNAGRQAGSEDAVAAFADTLNELFPR